MSGEAPTLTTGFPISERLPTTADERRAFTRKVNGMAQDAIDFIRAMKTYKGGDDVLWRLHRLNAIDKHRFLFTAGAAIRAFNAGQHLKATAPPVPELRNVAESLTDYWVGMNKINFPLKAGDVLLGDFPDAPVNESIQFVCDIALNEPGVCAGELLLVVLRQSMNRVRQVTIEFAAFLQ